MHDAQAGGLPHPLDSFFRASGKNCCATVAVCDLLNVLAIGSAKKLSIMKRSCSESNHSEMSTAVCVQLWG